MEGMVRPVRKREALLPCSPLGLTGRKAKKCIRGACGWYLPWAVSAPRFLCTTEGWPSRSMQRRCEDTLFEVGAPGWHWISAAKLISNAICKWKKGMSNKAFAVMMSLMFLMQFLGWKLKTGTVAHWHYRQPQWAYTCCIIIIISISIIHVYKSVLLPPVSFHNVYQDE